MDVHIPVMPKEAIEHLKLSPGSTVVDCTVGCAGHAALILEEISPGGKLIGIDQDEDALRIAEEKLTRYKESVNLIRDNFKNLSSILKCTNKVDGLLFDLGVSSVHFDVPERGFSIRHDGPLDMRMDARLSVTAAVIVNKASYDKLEKILREYGEERKARKIARFIVEKRKTKPIRTTRELADLVVRAYRSQGRMLRIHPATRVFQALRIAVNDELVALREGLISGIEHLKCSRRIVVISFHSLEDRIVKNTFKEYAKKGDLKIITKTPLRPGEEEVRANPRARSARLRVGERI